MGWQGIDPAEWARNAKVKLHAAQRFALQDLATELTQTTEEGGRVPVKTGNLARSLGMALDAPLVEVGVGPFAPVNAGVVLLSMKGDETVYYGFQANYARRQNFGFAGTDSSGRTYNQPGHGFVEAAAAKWPEIVKQAVIRVQKRTGG